mmetsp:Transcript_149/g.541  ORF Transcript_149/g.541 Transcript_149/m.541 type:complete len:245 (-) Transcript_149:561-1295(-)
MVPVIGERQREAGYCCFLCLCPHLWGAVIEVVPRPDSLPFPVQAHHIGEGAVVGPNNYAGRCTEEETDHRSFPIAEALQPAARRGRHRPHFKLLSKHFLHPFERRRAVFGIKEQRSLVPQELPSVHELPHYLLGGVAHPGLHGLLPLPAGGRVPVPLHSQVHCDCLVLHAVDGRVTVVIRHVSQSPGDRQGSVDVREPRVRLVTIRHSAVGRSDASPRVPVDCELPRCRSMGQVLLAPQHDAAL